jgi:hypothetical protein
LKRRVDLAAELIKAPSLEQFEEVAVSCPLCSASSTFAQPNERHALAEVDRQRHCRQCQTLFYLSDDEERHSPCRPRD